MNSKQDSPGSDNKLLRWPLRKKTRKILNNQSIKHIIKAPQKHLRNLEKLTLRIERLKRERELKSTESGRRFHAFTIRSLKSLPMCVKQRAS